MKLKKIKVKAYINYTYKWSKVANKCYARVDNGIIDRKTKTKVRDYAC